VDVLLPDGLDLPSNQSLKSLLDNFILLCKISSAQFSALLDNVSANQGAPILGAKRWKQL
jgi:hypothetical protein